MKIIQISDFVHISSNDISFLKFAKLKENNYVTIIFHKLKIFFIYWYFS
jgi:hypothetical protein